MERRSSLRDIGQSRPVRQSNVARCRNPEVDDRAYCPAHCARKRARFGLCSRSETPYRRFMGADAALGGGDPTLDRGAYGQCCHQLSSCPELQAQRVMRTYWVAHRQATVRGRGPPHRGPVTSPPGLRSFARCRRAHVDTVHLLPISDQISQSTGAPRIGRKILGPRVIISGGSNRQLEYGRVGMTAPEA